MSARHGFIECDHCGLEQDYFSAAKALPVEGDEFECACTAMLTCAGVDSYDDGTLPDFTWNTVLPKPSRFNGGTASGEPPEREYDRLEEQAKYEDMARYTDDDAQFDKDGAK